MFVRFILCGSMWWPFLVDIRYLVCVFYTYNSTLYYELLMMLCWWNIYLLTYFKRPLWRLEKYLCWWFFLCIGLLHKTSVDSSDASVIFFVVLIGDDTSIVLSYFAMVKVKELCLFEDGYYHIFGNPKYWLFCIYWVIIIIRLCVDHLDEKNEVY